MLMLPWFPRDFMASTRGWPIVAKGIFRELLDAQWDLCVLPADLHELQRLIGATDDEWTVGWARCAVKFTTVDGGLQNLRLEQHRVKSEKLRDSRAAAADRTNKMRGQRAANRNGDRDAERTADRDGERDAENTPTVTLSGTSPSPSPSPSPNPAPTPAPELALRSSTAVAQESRDVARGAVERVFKHWQTMHNHPRAQLDEKRRKLIRRALKTYLESDLCQAISGYLNSAFHGGNNTDGAKYDSIELMLRDAEHIDRGLKFYVEPPRSDQSSLTRRNVSTTKDWEPPELRNGRN